MLLMTNLEKAPERSLAWENKVIYGFIGRYVPQKNPLFLIDIFQ